MKQKKFLSWKIISHWKVLLPVHFPCYLTLDVNRQKSADFGSLLRNISVTLFKFIATERVFTWYRCYFAYTLHPLYICQDFKVKWQFWNRQNFSLKLAFNSQKLCQSKLECCFRKLSVYGGLWSRKEAQLGVKVQRRSGLYMYQHCLVHLGDLARYRGHSRQAQVFYRWDTKVFLLPCVCQGCRGFDILRGVIIITLKFSEHFPHHILKFITILIIWLLRKMKQKLLECKVSAWLPWQQLQQSTMKSLN